MTLPTNETPGAPARRRPRFRMAHVREVQRLTPRMVRITFGGDDLDGFESPAATQHVKLIVPEPGESGPVLPDPSAPRGAAAPDGRRPLMRTFTVRRFTPDRAELQIDFALHGEGPASQWAEHATPDTSVAVAGPGGRRYEVDPSAHHFLLAGDATALPAIGTLLEALPAGARADVYAEVEDAAEELEWRSAADVRVSWIQPGAGLLSVFSGVAPAQSPDRVWVACEAARMRRIRDVVLNDWHIAPDQLVTRGYWKLGESNYPDHDYGLD